MNGEQIKLSYSTIDNLYSLPHTWICKQMGLKKKNLPVFQEGIAVHDLLKNHVSGQQLSSLLEGKNLPVFPIVERYSFDPQVSRTLAIDGKYSIYGFCDGLNFEKKQILEIKSSSTPWTLGKLRATMQWKVYGLLFDEMEEVVLLTCKRDLNDPAWAESVAVLTQQITQADREAAWAWIQGAIDMIESGDFKLERNTGYQKCLFIGCPYCS